MAEPHDFNLGIMVLIAEGEGGPIFEGRMTREVLFLTSNSVAKNCFSQYSMWRLPAFYENRLVQ